MTQWYQIQGFAPDGQLLYMWEADTLDQAKKLVQDMKSANPSLRVELSLIMIQHVESISYEANR